MLRFKVYVKGKEADSLDLSHAYLAKQDGEPMASRFRFASGTLFCECSSEYPLSLKVPWTIKNFGRVILETSTLRGRAEPYNLVPELLRGHLARVWQKKDDWGYAFTGPTQAFVRTFAKAKLDFAHCLALADDPAAASMLAEDVLAHLVPLAETLAMEHAKSGFLWKMNHGQLMQLDFGCHLNPAGTDDVSRQRFAETFNYGTHPFLWRQIEPREHEHYWTWLDGWVHWLEAKGLTIKGGPLMMFTEDFLPDWLWIWENDFDTLRQYVTEHIIRCVERYSGKVDHWDAVTGLHRLNCMNFSMSQIMELTRAAARAVKQANPQATVILNLIEPWGEYYATSPRSIWPLTYAEMCLNTDVPFDAFGIEIFMGAGGYHARDMMSISAMLDGFDALGKPIHITAVGVPPAPGPDAAAQANPKG
ncbi:MAG: endo-1,4-beta-xylanase, partial [Planctomycetia bacterium]|nr:endo-1,4-beta-xylanase [Planctomycetia bacterium]